MWIHPSFPRPADKPFFCRMATSQFPFLLCLRPTLGNSQTAGCVLKSISNSNGQVIVCGELSFLLWRTMGAFLLCLAGSAAECRKHCLPKTPLFWGLLSSVMEMAISSSAEATDTYRVLGIAPQQEAVTFCVLWRRARMHMACILTINMKNSYMKTDYFCL